MPTVELTTTIRAPVERVFDLSRSVDCHVDSMAAHDERAVGGRTSGLLSAGDRVTWRARHFGVPFEMTVEIESMDRPNRFRDEMVSGPFAEISHDHHFEALGPERTRTTDELTFRSPLGPLGRVVDAVVMEQHLTTMLERRNRHLRRIATSGEYRRYLGDSS